MAATYTLVKTGPNADFTEGNKRRRVRDVTLSGTYTTGGDVLAASAFGLHRIDELIVHGWPSDGTVAYGYSYDYSTGKLRLFESATTGVAFPDKGSGESLTGITFRATAIGV